MREVDGVSILVIGDLMLDRYIVGDVERISPEAPVPVLNVTNEYEVLGGSGNVVRNLQELGCKVGVIGIVGDDIVGEVIKGEIEGYANCESYIYTKGGHRTTEKVRIISGFRDMQMLRYDREEVMSHRLGLADFINGDELGGYDIVVISDYAKGVINEGLMEEIKLLGVKVIVDPKPGNMDYYDGVYAITPNEKEFTEMMSSDYMVFPRSEYVLKTMGKRGIEVYMKGVISRGEFDEEIYDDEEISEYCVCNEDIITNINYAKKEHIDVEDIRDVYNVTGAGDTVVSVFALCTGLGMDIISSVKVANLSAGYVVTRSGTSILPCDRFTEYMDKVLKEN